MSDQSRAAAHDAFRALPDRPSLRHLRIEAKRRLAGGEFTALRDAQLAIAREHGKSSWAVLKQHIAAAEAERSDALVQVRWIFGRYADADGPEWGETGPAVGCGRTPTVGPTWSGTCRWVPTTASRLAR